MSRFPSTDRTFAFECNCQLVHEPFQGLDATTSTSGLGFPDVHLPADHQSEFLEGSVPVIHVPASLSSQLQSSPSLLRKASSSQRDQASTSQADTDTDVDMQDLQDDEMKPRGSQTWTAVIQEGLNVALEWLKHQALGRPSITPPGLPNPPPFCWHHHLPTLAVADEDDRVHVFDLARVSSNTKPASIDACLVLYHEFQRKIGALTWRPRSGTMLAVGCQHGVCLWTVGKGPMGSTALSKAAPGGGAWMTFLKMPCASRVDSLSFSPDGAYLAGCCWGSSHLVVWDVATGVSQLIRSGNSMLLSVLWSPCGNYIFAGGLKTFYLWETHSWRCEAWNSGRNSSVTRAAWAPDGRSILLSFHGTSAMHAIHFVEVAPSLKNQMLPVTLPECLPLSRVELAERAESSQGASCIRDFAWDPTGQRLAVLLDEPHPAAGTVAVYDVTTTPLITPKFIGYGRLPSPASSSRDEMRAELQFMPTFSKGALLSVRQDATKITNIPLYFAILDN